MRCPNCGTELEVLRVDQVFTTLIGEWRGGVFYGGDYHAPTTTLLEMRVFCPSVLCSYDEQINPDLVHE